MSIPTPKPTSDPYGPVVAKANDPPLSSTSSIYAPVSNVTSADLIKANMDSASAQNSLNANNSGRVSGGSKRRHKRSHKRYHKHSHKRSHKHSHKRSHKHIHKRSHKRKHRRSKHGGDASPTPTPKPTTTVPQFGSLHSGANTASINLNSGAMSQSAQAKYDDPNAPPSTTYFQ